jgi:DNA-binding IclR family transcriptional regulator
MRGIDRIIELLQCLHAARQALRIGELARRLNAPRSTIYEIVNRLIEAGILEAYDADGRVFFGRAVHFYAADYLGSHGLSRLAREEVVRLAEATGETAQYCMLDGNKYTVLHMQTGGRLFRVSSDIGVRVPIPWTASGRLLLDHMSRDEIGHFVPADDFILPNGRRIDPALFYEEVRRAREDGYCMTTGLVDGFASCIAVPVRDAEGIAGGCVCLVVMHDRPEAETKRLIDELREGAGRLSHYVRGSGTRFVRPS